MRPGKSCTIWLAMGLAAMAFLFVGGAWAQDTFECAPAANIEKDIAATAELAEFSCFMKRWEGADVLHFKVGVKNISDAPQRFRVNIFLDNGKAVGGLIPRKTNKGLVEPGKTGSFIYPVKDMTEKPGQITLLISTVSQ